MCIRDSINPSSLYQSGAHSGDIGDTFSKSSRTRDGFALTCEATAESGENANSEPNKHSIFSLSEH